MHHSRTVLTRTGLAAVVLGLTAALAVPATAASATPASPTATSSIPDEYTDQARAYAAQKDMAKNVVTGIMNEARALDVLDGKDNLTHKIMRIAVRESGEDVSYFPWSKYKGQLSVITKNDTFYYAVNLKKATARPVSPWSAARANLDSIAEAIAEETGGDLRKLAEVAHGDTVKNLAVLYGNGLLNVRVTGNFVVLGWQSETSGYIFKFGKDSAGLVRVQRETGVVLIPA